MDATHRAGEPLECLPPMIPVLQRVRSERVTDPEAAMWSALSELRLAEKVRPGMRIVITAGSRGIAGIPALLRTAVRHLKSLGAQPVIVAAMGSHGGGTAHGQMEVLRSLSITPETVETDVRSDITAVELGRTAQGLPVFFDAFAARADGILVINRVKPHTSFHGPLESGLVKMLVVGLGKPVGAARFHSLGANRLSLALAEIGSFILGKLPILGGVAILENGREETAALVPVQPDDMIGRERHLLVRARELLPRLPVDALDLLIVDEMGKDISGTGMDTNVIGRMGIHGVPDGAPDIQRIVVRDLTEASHGNANGMGLADFITGRFRNQIDFAATYTNTLTATFVERARMPVVLESDRAVIQAALMTLGRPPKESVRVIRIRNTLTLDLFAVSPAVWSELAGREHVEALGQPRDWLFDRAGNLLD